MIQTKIIDNWLGEELNVFLSHRFLYTYPHEYGEYSNNRDSEFYSYNFPRQDRMIDYLLFKLKRTIESDVKFSRIMMNIQHPGMDGQMHRDGDAKVTCVYMVTGNGDLIIQDQYIKFKKDKLIIFDSSKLHKGCAPTKGPRITLAFKISEFIENKKEENDSST